MSHICAGDYHDIAKEVKRMFHEANVHCTTIQPEFDVSVSDKDCFLDCGQDTKCNEDQCCPKALAKDPSTASMVFVSGSAAPPLTYISQKSSTAEWDQPTDSEVAPITNFSSAKLATSISNV
ncbi:hypothetical protein Ciccas_014359 [Cichlidogyrus casuarinus]|uniref:Uncharacterized protein n=1 Tax=Cichlidogyrus casuarinus TaxID=1844966 RepID=A0ABD2PJC5_9PLAT